LNNNNSFYCDSINTNKSANVTKLKETKKSKHKTKYSSLHETSTSQDDDFDYRNDNNNNNNNNDDASRSSSSLSSSTSSSSTSSSSSNSSSKTLKSRLSSSPSSSSTTTSSSLSSLDDDDDDDEDDLNDRNYSDVEKINCRKLNNLISPTATSLSNSTLNAKHQQQNKSQLKAIKKQNKALLTKKVKQSMKRLLKETQKTKKKNIESSTMISSHGIGGPGVDGVDGGNLLNAMISNTMHQSATAGTPSANTTAETYLIDRYNYAVRHIKQGLSVEEACNKYRISKVTI